MLEFMIALTDMLVRGNQDNPLHNLVPEDARTLLIKTDETSLFVFPRLTWYADRPNVVDGMVFGTQTVSHTHRLLIDKE